jgi:hypothetical protein
MLSSVKMQLTEKATVIKRTVCVLHVLHKCLVPEKLTLVTSFFTHAHMPVGKAETGV